MAQSRGCACIDRRARAPAPVHRQSPRNPLAHGPPHKVIRGMRAQRTHRAGAEGPGAGGSGEPIRDQGPQRTRISRLCRGAAARHAGGGWRRGQGWRSAHLVHRSERERDLGRGGGIVGVSARGGQRHPACGRDTVCAVSGARTPISAPGVSRGGRRCRGWGRAVAGARGRRAVLLAARGRQGRVSPGDGTCDPR